MSQSIFDTHVHFWNPEQLDYAWLNELPSLNRPFLPSHLQEATSNLSVTRWLFVQADCRSDQALAEIQWVTELAEQYPQIIGIVAFAPLESEEIEEHLVKLKNYPLVCGVRRLIQSEPLGFCTQGAYVRGAHLLADAEFTCDLCIRHTQLDDVIQLVSRCPETTFVLDHLGKPNVLAQETEPWKYQISRLAQFSNVACKLSGLITEADLKHWTPNHLTPYLDHALEAFGPDRLLFGSDWPVLTLGSDYSRWLQIVDDTISHLSPLQRSAIYKDNALHIYGFRE